MQAAPATPAPKAVRITYWVTTVIVSLMMVFAAYNYLSAPEVVTAFQHLGFPVWFRYELAVAKLLGSIVLLAPLHTRSWGRRLKEWAYAGFFFNFVTAAVTHFVVGDGEAAGALVFLVVLLVSYWTYQRLHPVATTR